MEGMGKDGQGYLALMIQLDPFQMPVLPEMGLLIA
jgi:hypothetical protein